jgi:hypothetical protein
LPACLELEIGVDALIERLHLLDEIKQAEKQLVRGAGVSHEAAKQRLSQWLQWSGLLVLSITCELREC